MLSVRNRACGWVGLAAALLIAPAAGALNITNVTVALGGTNTGDNTTTTGNNFQQTTSAVSTTQAPVAAPDTLGSFSELITRYAMIVSADRQNTTASTTATMVSSYSITFTVDNPSGETVQIDINTLRLGSLTSVTDSAGNSVITLGAITGQLDTVANAGLGAPSASQTSTPSADAPFSQANVLTFQTNALTSTYVLQFDWTSTVVSAQDGAAIRMGIAGSLPTTADDYPGVGTRTASADGHFVDVKATIISAPEPAAGALVAFGLLGLGLRAHGARARRR